MREASASGRPSSRTVLRTALAMSSALPASTPAAFMQTPSRATMVSPLSTNSGRAPPTGGICLAIDDVKVLGDEEMKVTITADGLLQHISKGLPHSSSGEYIGVALVPDVAAPSLIDSLERIWTQDASQFYEASFQDLAARRVPIETRSIGAVDWVEIDNLDDLKRANALLCRS